MSLKQKSLNFDNDYQNYFVSELTLFKTEPLDVEFGAQSIFAELKKNISDFMPALNLGAVAVYVGKSDSFYQYNVSFIQAKKLSQTTIKTLENMRKDIGIEILRQFNEYRIRNRLNELQWSEEAY